jgi:hypothetical protein
MLAVSTSSVLGLLRARGAERAVSFTATLAIVQR